MDEKFKNIDLDNEKINRIINCALEEFSKNNFEKASTNNIVKAANVSRGLMYHYFTDKQELYDFLLEFSITQLIKTFNEKFYWEETDLFSRIKQSLRIKLDVYLEFPYMMDFYINNVDKESKEKIRNDVIKSNASLSDIQTRFYLKNIDLSKFKEDIDIDKTINVIQWTMQKCSDEYQDKVRANEIELNPEELFENLDQYIEFLRDLFYK
ncbi:TetR/AcrR family transcriptional regulator [Vallitalea okinawensis]|uniref:TetR/AcrR family transcriptional regulator n=1 Tax=Vallitalea okinawensis TaxID=2078660 RepID=UPI000CFD05BA|nr:TetR/AcrR family transcriptional regulator [Vallitalea okinawensis]